MADNYSRKMILDYLNYVKVVELLMNLMLIAIKVNKIFLKKKKI